MNKKYLYIIAFVIIVLLVAGLTGWSIFIGKQQEEIGQQETNSGFFGGSVNTARNDSRGGIFGESIQTLFGSDGDPEVRSEGEVVVTKPLLQQVYNLPIAGFSVSTSGDTVRFVDRATGHVFERSASDETTTRLDQTTIPKVYEAFFFENAVLRRYLDDNDAPITHYGEIEGNENTRDTATLPNTLRLTVAPDTNQYAAVEATNNGSRIVVANANGKNKRALTTSALSNLQISWLGTDNILLTQNASESMPGSAVIINTESGLKSVPIAQESGLLTLPSENGNSILFSKRNTSFVPQLSVYNVQDGTTDSLDVPGLASKCVWSSTLPQVLCAVPTSIASGVSLDAWYRGEVQFSDELWAIDTDTGFSQLLFSPEADSGVKLDILDITLSANENVVFFKNKTDQTLWALRLRDTTTQN